METTADAARLTGVAERTIRRWIKAERLTARRRGRAWLVDVAEIEQLSRLRSHAGRLPRSDKR